jgi:sugar lactone lactonase YvrE
VTEVVLQELTAVPALEVGCRLGEGPVWDERAQELYFVDIMGERVHGWRPAERAHRSFPVGRPVGAAVLREDGGLVLAAHDAFFLVEADGSGLRPFGAVSIDAKSVRFNDGKVDPWGRFVAGTMDWQHKNPVASLYMLSGDGSVNTLLEDVVISNGLAWPADGRTLYYIDTPRLSLDAFDLDPETGKLSGRRVIAEFADDAHPDGMAIDDEGYLWVALWGGSRVERIDPATGRRLATIHLPTSHVSSVAFGGPHLDDLFITTAKEDLPPALLAAEPHAGDLFVARPGVGGPPPHRFKLA